MSADALAVDDLRIELLSGEPVVEDVSFRVGPGEVLGLVGESGCGKTTTALALLGYARPGVRVVDPGNGELHMRPGKFEPGGDGPA